MKYNLGCGSDYRRGWVNVDRFAETGADLVHDLLVTPWPIPDDAADEVLLSHVVEELSLSFPAFLGVLKELYRICKPDGIVSIRMQDSSVSTGLMQSFLSPKFFESLDLAVNETWLATGVATTPYGRALGVDFPVRAVTQFLEEPWAGKLNAGELDQGLLAEAMRAYNNVLRGADVVVTARKPFRPGRSLSGVQALVVRRIGGLGDVLMALSAFAAIKALVALPIILETSPEYVAFASLCPHVDGVFAQQGAIMDDLAARNFTEVRFLDWSPAAYGVAPRHEVDAFLQSLGLSPPHALKGLTIDLPVTAATQAIDARLADAAPHRRRIVLHPGISDPNRTWPPDFWAAVARHALAEGHAVITIGRNHGADGKGAIALGDPRILDFSDSLDLASSLHLLRRCDMMISGDAGPIQLAGASDIHIVGLYSSVSGRNRLPYRQGSIAHKAVAIAPGCPFHPCYDALADGNAVAQFCREEGIAPTDVSPLFARWCLNPDRYACTREPRSLDLVRQAIDTLA